MNRYTIDEIISKAISKEEEISSLYQDLSRRVQDARARILLKELSEEELRHKQKLQDFQKKKQEPGTGTKTIEDQHITSFLEKPNLNKYADLKEVLLSTIKDEEETHLFYISWAESMLEEESAVLLKKLAEEELRHRAKIEGIYKDMFSN